MNCDWFFLLCPRPIVDQGKRHACKTNPRLPPHRGRFFYIRVGSRESGVGSRESGVVRSGKWGDLTGVGFLHLGPASPPTPDWSGADHRERKRKTTKKRCSFYFPHPPHPTPHTLSSFYPCCHPLRSGGRGKK